MIKNVKNNKAIKIFIFSSLIALSLSGCAKKDSLNCPFTDINWENTVEEIIALEGDGFDTYDSMYQGTTYTYPKDYIDKSGTIKYMTNDSNELMNVSWLYTSEDAKDVKNTYEELKSRLSEEFGEPSENGDNVNNYNEIWKLNEGNIVLTAVITSDSKMVQVGFMNPVVSEGNASNPKSNK